MIFVQKNRFFSKGLYWLIWWNMGRNWPLEVFKVFFKQNSIFTLLLDNFWKNRKNRFFGIFFLFFSRSPAEYRFSGRISAGNRPETLSYHHTSFQKKWSKMARWTLDFHEKNVLGLHFGQNKVYYLRSLKSLN